VVKFFLWKMGNNLLPTKENLFKKYIYSPRFRLPTLLAGGRGYFSYNLKLQVFCGCMARVLEENPKAGCGEVDGKGLLQFLMRKVEDEDLLMAFMVSHLIWLRRNAVVFGREFTDPSSIVVEAKNVVQFFSQVTMTAAVNPHLGEGSASLWTPPPAGVLKINWYVLIMRLRG